MQRTVLKDKQHVLHQFDTTLSHHEECFTAARRDGARLDSVSLSGPFMHLSPYSYLSLSRIA